MKVVLIAVMATNRVIGRDNCIPWYIPEELRFFKKTTMGYPVIMGRKTFESLRGPLPGRQNIVISRNPDYKTEGTDNVTSIDQALAISKSDEKVFILGGSRIFERTLELADNIILSVLDRSVDGDTYFPEFSDDDFQEIARERHEDTSEPFTVYYYKRISPAA
jgi:dihydrofolate reductase